MNLFSFFFVFYAKSFPWTQKHMMEEYGMFFAPEKYKMKACAKIKICTYYFIENISGSHDITDTTA